MKRWQGILHIFDFGDRPLASNRIGLITTALCSHVEQFGYTYRVGNKVMQVANNYDKDTFKGDIGFTEEIDAEEAEFLIDFDGWNVAYPFNEMDEIVFTYATTIHKSQGSEYPVVVITVVTKHYTMLQRNLF